jgi:hypothetical protein
MAGFLDRFALGAGNGPLIAAELAARQNPSAVLAAPDDSKKRPCATAHYNSAGCQNRHETPPRALLYPTLADVTPRVRNRIHRILARSVTLL